MKSLFSALAGAWLISLVCVAHAQAEPPVDPHHAATCESEKSATLVDLNSATPALLEQLPGIGTTRARAIVAFRESHGGFTQVSQLMRIKGIGRAMLRKLRPLVTLKSAAGAPNGPPKSSTPVGDRLP